MRILQIINNLSTGGAEKLIIESIPLLQKKGIEVDLLVLDNTFTPYMKQLKELNCCNIYSLGTGNLYNPFNVFKIIPYLKKYELIHVHLFPAQYWVAIAKILSFSKVKLIFTEHNTSNKRMQNFIFRTLDRNIYRFYNKVICITNEVKDVLIKYCKFKSKDIIVIENGINLDTIINSKPLLKNQINNEILESDKLIIQIAGFRAQKDQKTVIRALKYLNEDVKLVLVGEGDLMDDCIELADHLGLGRRVFFLGVRIDVPNLLKTADLSVVSSHWEGFGLAAVEGMASGKPVIASNVPGLSNVVQDGGVLFEKGNEKELAKIIIKFFSDNDYYNKVANSGLEVSKRFSINFMIEKQLSQYKDLFKSGYEK
ncbi:glycosyltransferase [Flavobacterium chungbukense]|uniref:Glycosyltransferase family 1 protein n=1 Tax=Flavobacterium chungbukense TaxID=877464 RepID=A0ABP7XKB4_9FLAO|nr:glycosyltransferase [Flavobacterium chungbukense]MCC4922965.1 glycosyltransferase [Flavobacterium chungbukense]